MEYKGRKNNKDLKGRTDLILFLLFFVFTISLSVGYAALNSSLKISGEANFRVEADIRITDIRLYETTNMALENYKSKYSKDTITMGADLKQIDSTISYKVKITNSGTVSMWIDSIIEEVKNNDNMEYVIDGIGIKELINPGDTKEFTIKIKYKDSVSELPDNTNIDTILKFNFVRPVSILALGSSSDSTSIFFNGQLKKQEIEKITFMPTVVPVDDAIGSWDASLNMDGTVIASYIDSDKNGLYELYIGGVGEVLAPSNSQYLFNEFINVKKIDFSNCFKTDDVTSMYRMFRNCSSLLELDLSNFNTSKVTNMNAVFNNCKALTSLNLSSFNTSNVISFRSMFNNCIKLENLSLSNFNTSNVNDMNAMFYNCKALTSLDLLSFNTSKVTSFESMFSGASSLKNIDLSNFITQKITSIKQMFYECSNLESLNLTGFDTSKVTDMSRVFTNCLKLKTITGLDKFNTSNVKTMSQMFQGLKEMVSLDLSNFDTSKVTNMQLMFFEDTALTDVNLTSFNTSNLTTTHQMFYNCKSLKKLDLQSFDTTNVVDMSGMFNTCVALENILIDPNKFITSNTNNMSLMFYNCAALVNIDLSKFDTSNVNDMNNMFNTCTSLELIDLRSFTFNESVNTNAMFANTKPNVLVYVKDEAQKQYVLSIRNDLTNVQIKEA